MPANNVLEPAWQARLHREFDKPYMQALRQFLADERASGHAIYPPSENVFAAFNATPFDRVKVVILGQDPYHGPGQAHGLSFSVRAGTRLPPSLLNIFKERQQDLHLPIPEHGDLTRWAEQGVFLLNTVLTVRAGEAASHQKKGWETFTDQAIAALNDQRDGVVFLLWGSHAQKKGQLIDRQRHCVLTAPHPSPLSAHRGFLGCGHFSRANQYLLQRGQPPIDW